MKITRVKPLVVKIQKEDTFGGHGSAASSAGAYFIQPGWRGLYSTHTETTLVKIETDEGIAGFGEGQAPVGPEITAAVVDRVLGPFLLGRDASDVQVLEHEMYELMNVRGHYTGYMRHAISAIDIALWDIHGKKLGVPVAKLLGGVFRTEIPAYVSGIRGRTLDDKISAMRNFLDSGFAAFKTFLGFGAAADLEHATAFTQELKGRGRLMVDALWNYDVSTAIRLGRGLERLDVAWFEAPTAPEDVAGHAEIARALDLPVAAGETETTRHQFLSWFQQRALDIAQPDVARCGITETRRIGELAATFNLPVALHSGVMLGPGIAASLQVAAAIPNLLFQEFQPVMLDLANSMLTHPIVCQAGVFHLPAGPGLGIEVDEGALKPYLC
jgi:L-alanine-DL-glutamate epimerase-like enolase superfamily enzyme